jgi:hypothetical protein
VGRRAASATAIEPTSYIALGAAAPRSSAPFERRSHMRRWKTGLAGWRGRIRTAESIRIVSAVAVEGVAEAVCRSPAGRHCLAGSGFPRCPTVGSERSNRLSGAAAIQYDYRLLTHYAPLRWVSSSRGVWRHIPLESWSWLSLQRAQA